MILTTCAACAAPLAHTAPWNYAEALYQDPGANLDDLCKAVATLEETERTARRVFGSSHPETPRVQTALKQAREALAARAASSSSGAK